MDILDLFEFMYDPIGFLIQNAFKSLLLHNAADLLLMPVLFGLMIYIGTKKQGAFGGFINLAFFASLYYLFASDYTIPILSIPAVFSIVKFIYLILAARYLFFCFERGGAWLALASMGCLWITNYYNHIIEKPVYFGGGIYYGPNNFAIFTIVILTFSWIGWVISTTGHFISNR